MTRPTRTPCVVDRASRATLAPLVAWRIAPAALLLVAAPAVAQDKPVLDKPTITVTETSVLKYRFDNRNGDTGTNRIDDHYGEWLNRLNIQGTSGRFTAAFRLDSALYFLKPNPNTLATEDLGKALSQPPLPGEVRDAAWQRDFKNNRTTQYGQLLSERYVNAIYPSKFNLTYQSRGLEATVGDYYVQLGRGMVLAVRKIDELASDTTLRGGKIVYAPDVGKRYKLNVTAVGGAANPIRVDEVTGRLLSQSVSGIAENLAYPLMPKPNTTDYVTHPQPLFAPDTILGGQVEGGFKEMQVGVRAVQVNRTDAPFHSQASAGAPDRNAREITVGSVSVNVPDLFGHGSFYAELATQQMSDFIPDANTTLMRRLSGGYAAYAQATAFSGPFTVSLEGKHYERFFPLHGNVNAGKATEFSTVQYSVPPTGDPFTSDWHWGSYNVCVTGGRGRLDARLSDDLMVYGSVGHAVSYSERNANCGQDVKLRADGSVLPAVERTAADQNRVWDPFAGIELTFEQGRSHFYASSGVHFDATAEPIAYAGDATTKVYYRDNWQRYSLLKKIHGPWSLEMTGWHRWRYMPTERLTPWREGENYIGAIWSPKLTVALGYEYSTKEGDLKHYVNGMAQWRFTTASLVRAYVGQNRPALRCISGVCRQFPAFEGARLEAIVTF